MVFQVYAGSYTGSTKLHPGVSMDAVVDTSVAGDVAPGHTAVGGVDDSVTAQGGNVSLPEVYSLGGRR